MYIITCQFMADVIILFYLDNILTTLRRDGNVLIAVDTAGRVLELSQLLVSILTGPRPILCTSAFHNMREKRFGSKTESLYCVCVSLPSLSPPSPFRLPPSSLSLSLSPSPSPSPSPSLSLSLSTPSLPPPASLFLPLSPPPGPGLEKSGEWAVCLLHCSAQQRQLQCRGVCKVTGEGQASLISLTIIIIHNSHVTVT